MSDQENKSIVPHVPRALQREVDRQIDLMKAKAEVSEKVIDYGTEIHDHAGEKIISSALVTDMLLKGAKQMLNGSYTGVENIVRELDAIYHEKTLQCVGQGMASMLRQREEGLPVNPEVGLLARLGDTVAEVRDEWERARQEN